MAVKLLRCAASVKYFDRDDNRKDLGQRATTSTRSSARTFRTSWRPSRNRPAPGHNFQSSGQRLNFKVDDGDSYAFQTDNGQIKNFYDN